MNRQEHLDWCKKRALEYVDRGELDNAFASFQSDMNKHDELRNHMALEMMTIMFIQNMISTPFQMRHFIEGFN